MELEPANWRPLELRIGSRCAEFMWMWRKNGLEYYKHVDTRRYLILDATGRSYVCREEKRYASISRKPGCGGNRCLKGALGRSPGSGLAWFSLFATAAAVAGRRGSQLIVIGGVFSWLPFVREVASTWIAG